MVFCNTIEKAKYVFNMLEYAITFTTDTEAI